MNEIDWRVLQRMLIDFPRVDLDEKKTEKKEDKIKLTPETSEQFFNTLKSFNK